jgi:hypothetical protein
MRGDFVVIAALRRFFAARPPARERFRVTLEHRRTFLRIEVVTSGRDEAEAVENALTSRACPGDWLVAGISP